MLSVLRQQSPTPFSEKALDKRGPLGRSASRELAGREIAAASVVTIDPDDARISTTHCLEPSRRRWKLWFTSPNVALCEAGTRSTRARRRSNSTYLVDRVIPMLPEALSNELCSLKPMWIA
jgi:ribonuclease R